MDSLIRLDVDGPVAIITANNPPVNALSASVRAGLLHAVETAAASRVDLIELRCAGRTFFSGADIAELDRPLEGPGLLALQRACADAPQPVMARMHGHVLGGGVIIGMCADIRLAASDTMFGMPEVKLGVLATFGGTQYLPRLIGMANAIDLLVSGDPIDAVTARRIGFLDDPGEAPPRKRPVNQLAWQATDAADGGALIDAASARVHDQFPGWAAPLATLQAMRTGWRDGVAAGLAEEARLFDELKASRQSAVLRRLFFASRTLAKRGLPSPLADQLRDAAGGVYDRARAATQRQALKRIDPTPFGGPDLADAAIVAALGWPIWEADHFYDDPV